MNLVLDRMPDAMTTSLKALGSVRRKPKAEVEIPRLSVSLPSTGFDAAKLAAYRDICGFPESGAVPIPYPQVCAISLQMHLLTRPEFPLPLVGLVHLKNHIAQERELQPDETFALQVGVIGHKNTERGLEFELQTTVTDANDRAAWTAVATILHRRKSGESRRKGPPAASVEEAQLSDYKTIDAPGDIGRRYGRISGDMNPIHLYPFTAKLLGFDRHIAHGMWTMARCCALLQDDLGHAPRELEAQFRQPLFLPARAAMRYLKDEKGISFRLIGRDSGKTHLTGSLR